MEDTAQGSATTDPLPGAYRRAAYLLAMATLFIGALGIILNIVHPRQIDFISYWAAARIALQGDPASVYDLDLHHAAQMHVAAFADKMPFAYPPPFLLFILPFGLLPYGISAALWTCGTAALYYRAAAKALPRFPWLIVAAPPVLYNLLTGQNGFLTAALFLPGVLLLPTRPFIAGLILGCLVIKPQLAVLLPVALVAAGASRAILGAACSSLGLLLLAWAVFGTAAYAAMLELMPLFSSIAADGLVGWEKMASVYASLRLAGMPYGPALAVHLAVALGAAFLVWRGWRSDADWAAKAALLAPASLLISPYLFIYDTLLLVLPFFWLASRAGANWPLLGALWCLPVISIVQIFAGDESVNLMPIVTVSLLAMVQRRLSDTSAVGSGRQLRMSGC